MLKKLIILMACMPLAYGADDFGIVGDNVPLVLTPTRLKQSLANVPGSVTVITSDMLQRFGIKSVVEALRLVPGMAVTQVSGNNYRVNNQGTNILVPRRMNVLIDGISVYRPAIAQVEWKELPVDINDVERIEVTRGPNSASYGANSMLGIVNIITKHPKEAEGTTVSATGGSIGTINGMVRYGGKFSDTTSYRLTLGHEQDDGFDFNSRIGGDHDSTRLNKFNFRSTTDLTNTSTFDFQMAIVQGTKEVEFVDTYQRSFPDVDLKEHYISGTFQKSLSSNHDIKIQAYNSSHRNDQDWTTCPPRAFFLPEMYNLWRSNPTYALTIIRGQIPSGGTAQDNALALAAITAIQGLGASAIQPLCADGNQDYVETRSDIEFQDTYVFSDSLRMVSGFGARRDKGESQTYLGGSVTNNSMRVFSNVEYKPINWVNVNAGGFLERDQLTGSTFSPRLAFNFHVADNHTLRFVGSKGTRMPDIQEQRANQSYTSSDLSTPFNGASQVRFFQSATSPGGLKSETNISKEIGYFGNFQKIGLMVDARVFDNKLSKLISEKFQVSDINPTNSNSVRLKGAELQLNYEPNNAWMVFLSYAYLRNSLATSIIEQSQYSKNSGSFGVTHLRDNGWRFSLAYYANSGGPLDQEHYGREDLTISKTFALGSSPRLTTSFIVRHLDNPSIKYFVDYGRIFETRYDNTMQYFLNLTATF